MAFANAGNTSGGVVVVDRVTGNGQVIITARTHGSRSECVDASPRKGDIVVLDSDVVVIRTRSTCHNRSATDENAVVTYGVRPGRKVAVLDSVIG